MLCILIVFRSADEEEVEYEEEVPVEEEE